MYCLQLGTPKPFITFPTKISDQKSHKILSFSPAPTKRLHFFNCPRAFLQKPSSNRKVMANSDVEKEDFVTKVLRENPSLVEPKYLIGNRLYTLTEKETLDKTRFHNRVFEILRTLSLKGLVSRNRKESKNDSSLGSSEGVYLKDILREYKGKLYVPEQIFGIKLSEEEEFNRNFNELPTMSYEDFEEYLKNDKIKFLSFKEERGHYGCHFVVELKEIPGEKSLHRTKWALTLNEDEARSVLEQYRGPRSEIEKPTMSIVGKLPQYPHPVASKISSRLLVELMVLTTAMAAAAVIVGAFLAATIFVATVCASAAVVFVVWPTAKPFLKLAFKIVLGIVESLWDNLGDNLGDIFGAGGFFSRLYLMYKYSGIASGLRTLQALVMVFLIMVLLLRFTLSRKPKDVRKWDIWQGIEFSRSKAQARVEGTGVTFGDVAGIEEAVEELQELVRYLKNPELLDQLRIKPPHGVLLEGPPGCGKTLIAKAIAGEAGVPFYQMAGSEFSEILVGVGAARIRDLFKRAKVNKPAVIFIDEIDALGTSRRGLSQETDSREDAAAQERETTLNQLLVELDGFDTGKGVIFIGATNRKDLLDPALLRPGRFDRKIRITPPNARGRLEILKVHGRKVKLSDTVDLTSYAYDLPGWTGAELAALLQEAALVAVRRRHNAILREDLDDAVDRLTVGPKLVDVKLGHEGQCHRATTQVGAALTAHLLIRFENAIVERCDRISIIPRGQTLCQLQFHRLGDEVYMFERRPQLLHRLQVLLGGRAAEEVIFGKNTSKASVNYLADASVLARKIISIWNLENPMVLHGDPLPQRRRAKHLGPRIDFEGSLYDDYNLTELPINGNLEDETAKRTEELMNNMYRKTVDLLRQHSAALVKTIRVLLDKKEIRGDVIDFIIDNYPSQTPPDVILEEKDPGSLPFFEQKQAQSQELEYSLVSS